MHISEGVLSLPVLAGGWALCAAGTAAGLKKTPAGRVPRAALLSSVLFLCSLVAVPLGPSSVHLTLLGLSGYLLGWTAVPALFAALLLQALLFQFGGLAALGANTAIMGAAALSGFGVRLVFRQRRRAVSAFLAGFTAVLTGSLLIVAALVASDKELRATAALVLLANAPLAAVEGVLTLCIVLALVKIKPDVFDEA